jgi:putative transposase
VTPGKFGDQGIQYTSGLYQACLTTHGVVPSMSRKGNCYDNAVVESFFSSLKNEGTDHVTFPDRDHARTALFSYIELFYNRQRVHATLGYQSPEQYESRGACA